MVNSGGNGAGHLAPPHDLDAEAAVLAACLLDPLALPAVVGAGLEAAHFYSDANSLIFAACCELDERGSPVDVVTINSWLRSRKQTQQAGGVKYLAELVDLTPAVAHPEHYAVTVRDLAERRRVIDTAHRIAAEGYSAGPDYVAGAVAQITEAARPAPGAGGVAILDGPAIAGPLGPIEYLVPGLGLVAGGGAPHLVAGYGYSGKTVALQALALTLADGSPVWTAYRHAGPRRVLHVDLEQGERLTRRRYQRLAFAAGIDLPGLGDRLALATMPAGLRLDEACEATWRRLMTGRDLVIVDSLRAASPGADENSSEIRTGLDMLGRLSEETGCRAIVIHHARKSPADGTATTDARQVIRGSSAIFDGCDSVYVLAGAKGEPVLVEHVKARSHGELVESLSLTISDVDGDDGAGGRIPRAGLSVAACGAEAVAEAREVAQEARTAARTAKDSERVRTMIGITPGMGTRELRATLQIHSGRIAAALAALGDQIDRREIREGRTVRVAHYLAVGSGDAPIAAETWS